MNSEQYYEQPEHGENKLVSIFNTIRNIFMALVFFGVGIATIFAAQFKIIVLLEYPEVLRYFFGNICILYGLFRVWRVFNSSR